MEVKEPAWLNPDHLNFERWKKGREISLERAKFAVSVIEEHFKCKDLKILDLGSGEGGTAGLLSENNFVISADISLTRLLRQNDSPLNHKVNNDALNLPFRKNSFDLIILQDVIEHIEGNVSLLQSLSTYLAPNGIFYLSTPNKFSLFNIISDPHWGLPLLSLFKRAGIKKYFLKRFRQQDADRLDIAELLSLKELEMISSGDFIMQLNTVTALRELFKGNRGIVWSSFHLKLVRLIKVFGLESFLISLANNESGILNKYLTPTFYIILKKKNFRT